MNTNPIFFLHIPRTGGTTVDSIFFNNYKKNEILTIYKDIEYRQNREIDQNYLSSIKYITGHLLLSDYDNLKIYNQKVNVFTFLRNPISRLISEYIFYKTWKNNHLYNVINSKRMSFSDYLLSNDNIFRYRGKNFMTRCISGKPFIATKHPYAALAVAKKQLEKKFFFFGILERFTESIFLLSKILNLKNIFFHEHNKLKVDLKNCIDDKEKDIALDLNRADCELYNFAVACFDDKIKSMGNDFIESVQKFSIINKEYQKELSLCIEKDNIFLPKNYLYNS